MSNQLTNLKRSVVRQKMKKDGVRHIAKHDHGGPAHERFVIGSYFSRNWKTYK